MTGTPGGNGLTLSRLVMGDATWAYCRFPLRGGAEEQLGNRYRSLLAALLALDKNTEDKSGSPAGAWILHNPQWSAGKIAAEQASGQDPIFAPYQWFQKQERQPKAPAHPRTCRPAHVEGLWWHSGADARRTVEFIASGMEQCGRVATRAWMEHQETLLAEQMNLFACRIYLDPKQSAKLASKPNPSAPSVHVSIDFRFKTHLEESLQERLVRYWLSALLSVWTHKPSSGAHAPDPPPHPTGKGPLRLPGQVELLRDHYAGPLRAGFKERVGEQFHLAKMEILGREHRPPQFWMMRGERLPATPGAADVMNTDALNMLARVLLDVPNVRSAGVAAGVIRERVLMLRRFVPDAKGELPCYLVIPLLEPAPERENEARRLARELTDLEASAAAQLFEVVTSLDIYASHLQVYEAVVHQAEEFWDQLALYLPVTRGRRLSRVHRLIELVHNTLLQGIAELDQVAIQANKAKRTVERSANALKDQFDQKFTERPLPVLAEAPPISYSLTKTGYFDKAARQAERVHKDAEQVQRSYKTLLDGITLAFDERRVRGTDVLQHVGITLAILVVVFGFIPEALNAMFTTGWDRAQLVLIGRFGAAGFVLSGLLVFWWVRRLSTLGSQRFRRSHNQLRLFLADCATERLTRLRDDGWERVRTTLDGQPADEERAWDKFFAEWDGRDRALARQCAKILDALDRDGGARSGRSRQRSRLSDLASRVERWSLRALLVSERPRQFRQFALPRLTFLYRFYPMVNSELRSGAVQARETDVVSDSDFRFTVVNQCCGDHEQIDEIKDWAQRQVERLRSSRRPALGFVKALEGVGLGAGMTRKDFDAMLERMCEELRQT
ncbi:MAG: hypothetical protein ACRDZ4_05150 [Egibacteraceae bacterium]